MFAASILNRPEGCLGGVLASHLFDTSAQAAKVLLPGDRISRYRIIRELGRGGTSIVYLAERCDGVFGQRVAIKIAKPDPYSRQRAKHERNVLGCMAHPVVVQIYDGGTTAEGELWFAMELVEGDHIDGYCNRRAIGWRERLQLMLSICTAMEHIHARSILHCDIKPANVIVSKSGHVKIVDFGIARYTHSNLQKDEPTTTALTPGFASPEQYSGAQMTQASDVYQLGRMIEVLIEGATDLTRSTIHNIAAVVAKATRRDPRNRYSSVVDLSADVRRAINSRPVEAGHWNWIRRLQILTCYGRRQSQPCVAQ